MQSLLYTDIDPGEAARLTREALGGLEDGELYLQAASSESFAFDDGRLKTASFDQSRGFGLRGVVGEVSAYAHANEISAPAIRRAAETLSVVKTGGVAPASGPQGTNRRLYTDADPLSAVPFADKVALLAKIDAVARAKDPKVVQVTASMAASWSHVEIIRADGARVTDVRPLVRLNVGIVAERDGRRESGSWGLGGRHLYDRLFDEAEWERAIDLALAQALTNLDSVAAPAGEMPVVLGPGWPGILLHEAVGHGLEGDFNRKKASAFSGLMGQRVAAPGVTVVDDGTLPDRRGSITVDDEGTPPQRNVLIEDGILVGYLQDRQNARLMGVAPTGNGRRESHAHAPMPRMTNTMMDPGTDDPAAILSGLRDGIYAVGFGGGQVDITNGKFVFSCTEAYRVQGGEVGEPIRGATLIGDGATALQQIRAVGNDLALDPGIGNCGKQGQWVPVGVGQPTLMIGGLTVGGSAA